jgi:glycerol-3-phosphate dehydrogenase subunit C
MRKIVGSVPGLTYELIDSSCCGMAGSFGLEAEHRAASQAMTDLSLLPALRAASGETRVIRLFLPSSNRAWLRPEDEAHRACPA